jgi:SAM-dependent methyltransferase
VDPTEHNRKAWDEIHRRRAEALAGRLGIPDPIRERLHVSGKHVLHLQCGTGESTAELVELGALVTAVDISADAIEVARERSPDVVFMHADVHELPLELHRGRFDLVYTGGGVMPWIRDLRPWAAGIASALKPGGTLLLFDDHPVAACVDHLAHWREDYFAEPEPDPEQERRWRLGQIVTGVAEAGLLIRSLEEFVSLYRWRDHDRRVPGQFVLIAEKPHE